MTSATAIIMKMNRVLSDSKLAKTSRLEKKAMRALERQSPILQQQLGPACLWASCPVRTKIPAPITEPNPNQVRSHQVRQRFMSFSLCFRSSPISMASSDRLMRRSLKRKHVRLCIVYES
ncbi:hypothetical protein Tsubulata_007574 [Turnera subulata]|uniref:Uncharacterized protein n=1 Tax=Turnera subulata TaxID=218843 RepID=A0A9Q0FGT2_9ROSI|nr:hypothetical protein Tsubulata_007574 [Turnera subulata]